MANTTASTSIERARELDAQDPLRDFRNQFHIPRQAGVDCLYFTGNSLGLQPKSVRQYVEEELKLWEERGVEGHVEGPRPWKQYHEFFAQALANLVGAKTTEVVAMNGLTTNLHLLMVSFYRPEGKRNKILCEGKAFPSDQYALKSQLRFRGLDPKSHLIEIMPDAETAYISTDEILQTIAERGDEIALLMMGGVNYYSGQKLDMGRITAAAKAAGITVGWDLAHATGNVQLHLHDWEVDFAAWCGYKYLNGGPGAVSGIYIHEKYHGIKDFPRFEGWWGHDAPTRFAMPEEFVPMPTAEAWQLSNAPVLSMTPLLANLQVVEQAGFDRMLAKSHLLTQYLYDALMDLRHTTGFPLRLLTPADPAQRGCQISIVLPAIGRKVFEHIQQEGVIADWREPDVIRVAPVPLYNRFEDVQLLVNHMEVAIQKFQ